VPQCPIAGDATDTDRVSIGVDLTGILGDIMAGLTIKVLM